MLFTNLVAKIAPFFSSVSSRVLLLGVVGLLPVVSGGVLAAHQFHQSSHLAAADQGRAVLAADTERPDFEFNVNVPSNFAGNAVFGKDVTVKGDLHVKGKAVFSEGLSLSGENIDLGTGTIKASNIVYSLAAGNGIGITAGQTPTITNNGVLSLQGKTGALSLTAGDGITIDGLKISSNVSSSDSFKNVAVSGQDTLSAGSSTDTLTFAAGTGITLTTDATNKKLTITNSSAGAGASGVSSLNGGTGTLTLGNATLSGSSLTIDDASTTGKGIASFNGTNFSVANGAVNLIQNIDVSATPTFANLTLSGLTTAGGVLYTNSSGDIAQLSAGTTGYVLASNGTGATPSWTALSSLPSVNSWQENAGALSPKNITDSLNLGGVSTASALLHLAGTPGENSFINTGNLGIGSTVPNEKLDVNGRIYLGDTSSPTTTTNRLYAQSGSLYWNGLQLTTGSGVNGASQWSDSGPDINYARAGNVGIGSANPVSKLDVNGGIAVAGTQIVDSSRNVTNINQVNSNLTPGTNNTYDLGSASDQWNNIYGQNLYLAGNLITSGSSSSGGSLATFTSSGAAVLRIADNDVFFGGRTTMKTDDTNLANTVDVFAYDTGKDVDGGKWVKSDRIQSTSWYSETLDHTNQTCNIGTDDRCGSKAFPQKASLVLTSTALYIFDTLDNTMWMKFTRGSGEAFNGSSVALTSVYALNGVIYVGTSTNGLIAIDLINDQIYQYDYNGGSGGRATFKGNIAARNANTSYGPRESWGQISADKVNGVTARLLRGKLYVVAATLTGASVINVTDHRVIRYIDQ